LDLYWYSKHNIRVNRSIDEKEEEKGSEGSPEEKKGK
jgi:hypothetical protein